MNQGILIAFEGIDGTGKSTQLPQLAAYLRSLGLEVIETREPTTGVYGQEIRSLFQNRQRVTREHELELFLLDRRQHVEECILPALAEGKTVLTDRYYFSTAAYQGAAGCNPTEIFARNSFAPEPDLVLLLVMSADESIARIRDLRGEELNDFEQRDQLEKVATLFASFPHGCIVRIPAARPMMEVQSSIREAVLQLLENKGVECAG